jgi:hypothetical protein
VLVSVVTSWASELNRGNAWSPVSPRDELRIVVQVCLPDKTVLFEDVELDLIGFSKVKTMREERAANGYSETGDIRNTAPITVPQIDPDRVTIRHWVPGSVDGQLKRSFLGFGDVLNQDGILSAGSFHISLWNNSEKSQPIYETHAHRLNDTIALYVSAEVSGQLVKYWYKPPSELPTGQFSNWQEPISQETKEDRDLSRNPTFWNLTHGMEMEIHPVAGNAPKIRYQLMSVEEYFDQYRYWNRAQKAVGEKFYRGIVGEEREKRHFVPRVLGAIPGC